MKKTLRDYLPILMMLLCAAGFGALLLTGVIDLNTVPQLVEHRPVLAVLVILALFIAKGFSGVVVYNALVVVVSLILPLPAALAISGVGTALCLSISYWMGRSTRTDSLEGLLSRHPKLSKYFTATQQYGFVFCFTIHMLGLNMELLGVLFGMMRLNFWTYLSASWLSIAPGMVCLCILGNNLDFKSPVFWAHAGAEPGAALGFPVVYPAQAGSVLQPHLNQLVFLRRVLNYRQRPLQIILLGPMLHMDGRGHGQIRQTIVQSVQTAAVPLRQLQGLRQGVMQLLAVGNVVSVQKYLHVHSPPYSSSKVW